MEPLFAEFSNTSYNDWLNQLKKDLKSDNVANSLFSTSEGITIPTYFSPNSFDSFPDPVQFKMQHHPEFAFSNYWETCVAINTDDLVKTNKQALLSLNQGASSIRFTGHEISNQEELNLVLRNIQIDIIQLHFDCGEASPTILYMLLDEVRKRNLDLHKLSGSISYDPFTDYAFKGSFDYNQSESIALIKTLLLSSTDFPNFRTLTVNAAQWHNAGATTVQELALTLSVFAEYFEHLKKGVSPQVIAQNIHLRMASGGNYLLNIAKFRSIRLLWSMFLQAYNLNAQDYPLYISAETALCNKTLFDPYNNLLRNTTESMAAVIAGVDELLVYPHNFIFAPADADAQRLALNIQHLLQNEGHFDKVAGIANGSYYIENLTHTFVEQAWQQFLVWENKGGYIKCLQNNDIQPEIAKARQETEKAIRKRKKIIVGVNQFSDPQPNIFEVSPQQVDPLQKPAEIKIVEPFREAMLIEQVRKLTHQQEKNHSVFLLRFGNPAKQLARSAFATELMQTLGYTVHLGNPENHIWQQSQHENAQNASTWILCAADEDYLNAVSDLHQNAWPDKPVIIAGKPATETELLQLGVDAFIFAGCDILEIGAKLANLLGFLKITNPELHD